MNKLSIFATFFGAASSSIAVLPFVVSCGLNDDKKYTEDDFTKSIIKSDSFENIVNRLKKNSKLFFKNISEQEFEKQMKKIFKEELIIDETSLIFSELTKLNKIDEFKSNYVNETYNAMLEEMKNETAIETRHWVGFWQGHSWDWIARRLQSYSLNLLVIADWALQVGPAIAFFIKTGDTQPMIDTFSSFEGKMTSFSMWLFIKGVEDLRNWKINTNCKSNFNVWGQIL